MKSPFFALCGCLLFLLSCNQTADREAEYRQIEETSSGLEYSTVLLLDTQASWISWKVQKTQGPAFMQGKLRLSGGSLVVEKGNVIAGFVETDIWKNSQPDSVPATYSEKDKTQLCDSFPRICSAIGSRFRMDLEQTGRFVARSEFRQDPAAVQDSGWTHQYQFKLTMADSTLPAYCQVKQQTGKDEVLVEGFYKLQVRDFGIFVRPRNPNYVPNWYTEIPLRLHLVFRKKKVSGKAAS